MRESDSDEGGSRRRRPASVAYTLKTEAVRIVEPLKAEIAAWSPRAAYLRAIAQRSGVPAAVLTASREEAQTLLLKVRQARTGFAERLKDLAPEIASHGRIVDAERALDALEGHLSEALLLLSR